MGEPQQSKLEQIYLSYVAYCALIGHTAPDMDTWQWITETMGKYR